MKQKGRGHATKADIEQRRSKVLALYLRGLSSGEIAQFLEGEGTGISRVTVHRDIQALEQWLKVEFEKDRRFLRNKALMELDLLWREGWLIFLQPSSNGKDPLYRKLAALRQLSRIWQMKWKAYGSGNETLAELARQDNEQAIITDFINSIRDAKLRRALRDYVVRSEVGEGVREETG